MGLLYNDMRREEKNSIEKLGDAYRHYMQQVPRMNFVAGMIRLIRRRSKNGTGATDPLEGGRGG